MPHPGWSVRGGSQLRTSPACDPRGNSAPMPRGGRLGLRACTRFWRRSHAYPCGRQLRWCASRGYDVGLGLASCFRRARQSHRRRHALERVRLGHPNEWLKLGASDAAAFSPLLHLPELAVPLVVSYAPNETDEFKRQSEVYMAAVMARGCQVRFVPMPGTSHFDIVFGLADPQSPLAQ